ncbi:FAP2 [Scenedesmus sp. PABB004]|nr:FAP2 [Scenedesmus sp. PABB004]
MFAESGAPVPVGPVEARRVAPLASLTFSLGPARGRVAPFAAVSSGAFGAALSEPATGLAYAEEFCVLSKRHCPKLAGVGVRAKRILGLKNINVYTVGLYVDGSGAKKALGKFKGSDADKLTANQAAFDGAAPAGRGRRRAGAAPARAPASLPAPPRSARRRAAELVASTAFEKSLRLVISFGGLKRATFLNALEERLKPALTKAKEPAATLKAFEGLFDGVTFRKGTEIAFASHHKGQLVTQIDGKQVGSISSPALVKALFDIYVGPDPVSDEAKRSIGRGLAALVNE